MVDSVHMMKNDSGHLHNSAFHHSWHGLSAGQTPFRRDTPTRSSLSRKQLPSTPDMETQTNLAAKMIDRRTSTPRGNHSYGPFFLEYSLLAEFNLLQKQKMPGVYVIPSAKSPLTWFGVIFVRQGIYQEAIFRFKLVIPENYPDGDCPRLFFDHPVFHPIVDPTSFELDVQRGFHKWKRNVNHIWQILLYTRRIFYKIDTTNPLNKIAANLYDENLDAFKSRVSNCISEWKSRLFDIPAHPDDAGDPHYITFAPYDAKLHEPIIKKIVDQGDKDSSSSSSSSSVRSLSFVDSNTLQIFSRNTS